MMTKEAVLAAIEEQQVKFVVLWFTDITGHRQKCDDPGGRSSKR